MNLKRITLATFGALLLVAVSSSASAALATISNVNSSDDGDLLFDPTTTMISTTGDPMVNMVSIGLSDFVASSSSNTELGNALDTISMTVTAPTGYVITKVNYFEAGNYNVSGGVSVADGSLVVNGESTDLGNPSIVTSPFGTLTGDFEFGFNTPVSIDVPGLTEVDISATNSLFAVSFGASLAEITKTDAFFEVELAPVPLPPALWMLGSAVIGLVAVRRKQAA